MCYHAYYIRRKVNEWTIMDIYIFSARNVVELKFRSAHNLHLIPTETFLYYHDFFEQII